MGIALLLLAYVATGLGLRYLGRKDHPRLAVVQPVNTTGLVLKSGNTPIRDANGTITAVKNDGGDLVDVIHTVPGARLDKSSKDPMEWNIVKGEGKEPRGLLYYLFGVQFIGLLNQMRINTVRTFRWGRKPGEKEYSVQPQDTFTAFPHYSGQHDLDMKGVETKEVLKFDLRFNFTLEEKYPVRARLLTADSYASFSSIAMSHVNAYMGEVGPEAFLGATDAGDETKARTGIEKAKGDLKLDLIKSFASDDIVKKVEKETGLFIREANMPNLDFDGPTRELLEKLTRARIEGRADIVKANVEAEKTIIDARAKNKKGMLENEVTKNRIDVLKEAAGDPELAANFRIDREAEALEKLQNLTTLVGGNGSIVSVPAK